MSSEDESLEAFRSSAWKMPVSTSPAIPLIAVNDEEAVDLAQLEPKQRSVSPSASRASIVAAPDIGNSSLTEDEDDDTDKADCGIRQKLIRKSKATTSQENSAGQPNLKFWRRKLVILIWLNFMMKYRKLFLTFVELIFPIICFAIICVSLNFNNTWMIQFTVDSHKIPVSNPFHPLQPMSQERIINYVCSNNGYCDDDPNAEPGKQILQRYHFIAYSPNDNEFVNDLMDNVKDLMRVDLSTPENKFFGVPTKMLEKTLKTQWDKQSNTSRYPYGVQFSFGTVSKDVLKDIAANRAVPENLRYIIRTFYPETANTDESFPFVEHSMKPKSRHEVSPYISTGFCGMQLAIDLTYVKMVRNELNKSGTHPAGSEDFDQLYGINVRSPYVRMYDYPIFVDKDMKFRTWITFVLAVILAYACTNFAVVQEIAEEARAGRMELLKLHGLTPALHWVSYGINMCVISVMISLFMAFIIYYSFAENSILQDEYDHVVIIWFFFFLHGVAQYTDNLLITHFISRPGTAGMFAVFKSIAEFLIPMHLFRFDILGRIPNFLLCLLLPQWCLANGIFGFLQYELYENGLDWYDFPVLIDSQEYIMASIPFCCFLYIYNITIFLLLTIYCDRVFSKPYAPSITWEYLWKTRKEPKPEYQKPPPPINYKEMPQMYERPPLDMKCTIRVRNLCKTFATEKSYEISLDNISVDIFEGEILGVVGPAGSGKTNFLHLITGLIDPTSGFVEMKNLKVHEYSDILNHYMSICPQKCMLFPTLSVEDHVRLCCMVHGNSYKKSKLQAKLLLQLFSLQGARRHGYLWLSKTQVKKLAIAMALASSPTVLMLDEPTQGMELESAKQVWKYLLALKSKRTIIVATSTLEDAELFCDRMLLLVNGKVVCYGTANRIKRYYDAGSIINIQEGGEAIPYDKLQTIVDSEVHGATKLKSMGFEKGEKTHRFLLPLGEPYAALLEKIEDIYDTLKYKKMWISRLDIEALLYKISNSKMIESAIITKTDYIDDVDSDQAINNKQAKLNTIPDMLAPERSLAKHFRALLTKKWLAMTQKNRFLISEFMVPIAFMIMMVLVVHTFLKYNPESLGRTLAQDHYYNKSVTLIKPVGSNRDNWIASFQKSLKMRMEVLEEDANILNELNRRKGHTLTNDRQQAIIAADKIGDVITGYYSSNSYHSCPIVINLMTNAVLGMISDKEYRVDVSNHPMPQYQGFPAGSTQNSTVIMYAYILSFILALISAAEMQLPLWERHHGMKVLERMAGVHPTIYWFTNYCGDFAMNAVLTVILMGILCVINMFFNPKQFEGESEKLVFALILFGYLCWSSVPYAYFLSCVLKTSNEGFTHFLVIHFTIGILPVAITYQILRVEITGFFIYLRYILHIFPPYSITSALVHYFHVLLDHNYCKNMDHNICDNYAKIVEADEPTRFAELHHTIDKDHILHFCCRKFCESESICHQTSAFFTETTIPGLYVDVYAMAAQGVAFWIIVIIMEYKVPHSVYQFLKTTLLGDKEIKATIEDTRDSEEPENVKKEHQRVDYMIDIEDNVESEVILVQDVCKFYRTDKCIDHIYFSIPLKKTTGLLGLAKSGMTTLLRLLTFNLRLSAGNIYMDNEHVTSKNRRQCLIKIGYCPQDNAYYENLTGFQMLKLFAQLRGVPESLLDVQVRRWITTLDLENVARMSCKGYRPGALRRLCCAMAMIGWTRVVILDEPTADMDLRERDIFWKAIHEAKKKGQTTFFTTTYAEEVRYNTDKAMILDSGEILSVDKPAEVFKENPSGFMMSIKMRALAFRNLSPYQIQEKKDQLRDHIISHLSPCELLVDEDTILIYQLKDLTTKLSYAYGIMEGARERFPNLLDNFLIAESSLDDVIFNLHKKARMRLASAEAGEEVHNEYRTSGGGSI